jgi:hypothetical protein
MRVNSPGPCAAAGAGGAGAGAGADAEKILGAGALGVGAEKMLGAGAAGAGCGGALGVASGAFIARNIAVKLPGSLPPGAGAAGGAGAAAGTNGAGADEVGAGANGAGASGAASTRFSGATAGNAGGVWPEAAIFSIGTGLNTLASSSLGRAGGAAIGSGVLSACSIRVNSPCGAGAGAAGGAGIRTGSAPNEVGGAGAGTGAGVVGAIGNGTGSAANMDGDAGTAAAAGCGGGAAAVGPCGFFPRAASRSSSSCVGELGTLPKIPVALEGDPPPGSSDCGDCGGLKRSLIGSMRVHHLREKLPGSGIQDYIDLA